MNFPWFEDELVFLSWTTNEKILPSPPVTLDILYQLLSAFHTYTCTLGSKFPPFNIMGSAIYYFPLPGGIKLLLLQS